MVYVLMTDGFEELEAVAPIDLLRRAGANVVTVGIGGKTVKGSHDMVFTCDTDDGAALLDDSLEMLVLPGGPGYKSLDKSPFAEKAINFAFSRKLFVGAICAAPSLLGKRGLLQGLRATSYPSYLDGFSGVQIADAPVVRDGFVITASGAGASVDFALFLVEALYGKKKAHKINNSIGCHNGF